MAEVIKSKAKAAGRKSVTNQIMITPFGSINVKIGVSGYKSSEGEEIFTPPTEKDDELDGAEAQTEES